MGQMEGDLHHLGRGREGLFLSQSNRTLLSIMMDEYELEQVLFSSPLKSVFKCMESNKVPDDGSNGVEAENCSLSLATMGFRLLSLPNSIQTDRKGYMILV
jgi:hypothetical protein